MDNNTITLSTPDHITVNSDGLFSFEVYLTLSKGGRYTATCGLPIQKPLSAFASISPVQADKTNVVCMVRSVEWVFNGIYLTFELVQRDHWLKTGELKPFEDSVEICLAFHGKLNKQ